MSVQKIWVPGSLGYSWRVRGRILLHLPFLQPKISAPLFATVGGVLVALSLEFIVLPISTGTIRPWGPIQNAGVLLFAAALGFTSLSFLVQSFSDRLHRFLGENDTLSQRSDCFLDWRGRWAVGSVFLLSHLALFSAMALFIHIVQDLQARG